MLYKTVERLSSKFLFVFYILSFFFNRLTIQQIDLNLGKLQKKYCPAIKEGIWG